MSMEKFNASIEIPKNMKHELCISCNWYVIDSRHTHEHNMHSHPHTLTHPHTHNHNHTTPTFMSTQTLTHTTDKHTDSKLTNLPKMPKG